MTCDDFSELRKARFVVDDDNEPVPENVPVTTTADAVSGNVIERNDVTAES